MKKWKESKRSINKEGRDKDECRKKREKVRNMTPKRTEDSASLGHLVGC
jgi:hypothetical protein